jgi:hypothetical protein
MDVWVGGWMDGRMERLMDGWVGGLPFFDHCEKHDFFFVPCSQPYHVPWQKTEFLYQAQ